MPMIQGHPPGEMPLSPLSPQAANSPAESGKSEQVRTDEVQNSFGNILNEALQNVQDYQSASTEKTEQLLTGEVDNMHDVFIASEKAGVALQATVEVRDKVIDAYDSVMRMTL
ncbi:flagellar hook-basal body complex protein FliE [Salicibibacter cibarius]|uniref:Flagellar hook-basal body complex protein FliE n=1 Tax=Salicibibacter cibarius TaxID=2743000 RepID=A0A7T7CBW6_9BACI|nr:flagellar hook-basal body complex protein FliE [Salicibibacter cibarius]QQK76382.1 flagellar hook-basal body complex protein FliE [Salicibibacter cibarius]